MTATTATVALFADDSTRSTVEQPPPTTPLPSTSPPHVSAAPGQPPAPAQVHPSGKYPVLHFAPPGKAAPGRTLAQTRGDQLVRVVRGLAKPTHVTVAPGRYEISDVDENGFGLYGNNLAGFTGATPHAGDVVLAPARAGWQAAPGAFVARFGQEQVRDQRVGNFTLEGTDQTKAPTPLHYYSGVLFYDLSADAVIGNLHAAGIPGTTNYPPGETAAFSILGGGGTDSRHMLHAYALSASGIRPDDGALVGASPMEWNKTAWVDLTDGVFADTFTSMPSFSDSTDCTTHNLSSERMGTAGDYRSGTGINHEGSTRITHYTPTLHAHNPKHPYGQTHLAVASADGDCEVTVIAPRFDSIDAHPDLEGKFTVNINSNYPSAGVRHQRVTGKFITVVDAAYAPIQWVRTDF